MKINKNPKILYNKNNNINNKIIKNKYNKYN